MEFGRPGAGRDGDTSVDVAASGTTCATGGAGDTAAGGASLTGSAAAFCGSAAATASALAGTGGRAGGASAAGATGGAGGFLPNQVKIQPRKLAIPWLLAAGWLVLLVLHEAALLRPSFVEQVDAAIYDFSLKRSAPRGLDDRITILDIDEASLKAVGRWPWSRDKMLWRW